jgi:AraC family transcriptional regulator, regulatory protein of adaptative response / methylated-DNA-[protein]-cysteine methyltransferase
MSPEAPRQVAAGHEVRFGIFATVLGPMLVAGTALGICHVSFGDDEGCLLDEFRADRAAASLSRDEASVASWAEDITAQLDGRTRAIDVPIDVSGTPFQQRVWTELHRIPFGQLRSYQELAVTMGQPTAARAVAGACASNRVAVVIPCHRVIRGTGELGGYRWGVERKRKLLDIERQGA